MVFNRTQYLSAPVQSRCVLARVALDAVSSCRGTACSFRNRLPSAPSPWNTDSNGDSRSSVNMPTPRGPPTFPLTPVQLLHSKTHTLHAYIVSRRITIPIFYCGIPRENGLVSVTISPQTSQQHTTASSSPTSSLHPISRNGESKHDSYGLRKGRPTGSRRPRYMRGHRLVFDRTTSSGRYFRRSRLQHVPESLPRP